jgi:hypothetical protein
MYMTKHESTPKEQSRQAGAQCDVEITPQMIEAGVLAAQFEEFERGWSDEEALVRRVYVAMACTDPSRAAAK